MAQLKENRRLGLVGKRLNWRWTNDSTRQGKRLGLTQVAGTARLKVCAWLGEGAARMRCTTGNDAWLTCASFGRRLTERDGKRRVLGGRRIAANAARLQPRRANDKRLDGMTYGGWRNSNGGRLGFDGDAWTLRRGRRKTDRDGDGSALGFDRRRRRWWTKGDGAAVGRWLASLWKKKDGDDTRIFRVRVFLSLFFLPNEKDGTTPHATFKQNNNYNIIIILF